MAKSSKNNGIDYYNLSQAEFKGKTLEALDNIKAKLVSNRQAQKDHETKDEDRFDKIFGILNGHNDRLKINERNIKNSFGAFIGSILRSFIRR